MKRINGFLIAFFLSAVLFSVVAQEEENEQNALRNYAERSLYKNNWFISLGGNANLLTAEQDGDIPMKDRIKYGGQFTLGKWFTPDFGVRLQAMYGGLRGFNYVSHKGSNPTPYVWNNYDHRDYPLGGPIGGDLWDVGNGPPDNPNYTYVLGKIENNGHREWGFWQDFNYATATFDLMANFTNLFRGYYKDRSPVDFVGFFGIGAIHAFNNKITTPDFTHFVAKIGFRMNLNFSRNFAFFIEPQGNMTTKEFDGYAGDNFGDGVVNVSAGFQVTFNKRFNSISQLVQLSADEIDKLNKKINDQRYLIENHQDILERQQNLLDRLGKCCDETTRTREVVTQPSELVGSRSAATGTSGGTGTGTGTGTFNLPEYVRFALDSYKIEPIEQRKLVEVADYMKQNPNSRLLIVGYADRKTGTPPYNFNLSQKRVEGVAAELKRLGINANRLIIEWKGDKEQPFPQNEWNRVVVMVERK